MAQSSPKDNSLTPTTSHRDRLSGKVAILTAATDGIGFATAQRIAREGAHVVISSRKKNNVDSAVAALKKEVSSIH